MYISPTKLSTRTRGKSQIDLMSFSHLSIHTHYSIVDSIVRIDELVEAAAQRDISALALTDHRNLFAMLKFYKACRTNGIKPIIGADLRLVEEDRLSDDGPPESRFIVLAQDELGFANLRKLLSLSYRQGEHSGSVHPDLLAECREGLILLSGGVSGGIGQLLLGNRRAEALARAREYQAQFEERFYLQVARTGREFEEAYNVAAVDLADELGLPLIATNEVCMISSDQYEALGARLSIQNPKLKNDEQWREQYSPQQYLRSAEEMAELFEDLPDALENACEVAKRCNVVVPLGSMHPPRLEDLEESAEKVLEKKVHTELDAYLKDRQGHLSASEETYRQRLDEELSIIEDMHYADYFLIVHEIVDWAKQQDIPVGPGRGSGGGSLVALMLNITMLDPLEYDLIFERFLNPERVSMPDFDIDICQQRRGEVIQHIIDLFGIERVGLIVTFNTMAARLAIHDSCRYLGIRHDEASRLAACIPPLNKASLSSHLEENEALKAQVSQDDVYQNVMTLATQLEGLVRGTGRHPAGVVIAPGPIEEYVPVFTEGGESVAISQLDKDDVEEAGLVKFDFLGLKTLTVLDRTLHAVNSKRDSNEQVVLENIPLDDSKTFDLIQKADTEGVFQLESGGMRNTISRLKPDRLEDLGVLNALYRPGPLETGVIETYTERKSGQRQMEHLHPLLEPVLNKTYGEMVYQEDVMNVSRALSGFSLGSADNLRRAMGKKNAKQMQEMKNQFIEGASNNGVSRVVSEQVFDRIEKFANYAFPRAHAMSYALVTYQTAYLKANFADEYMAAYMSTEYDSADAEKMPSLFRELHRLKIALAPPSVNQSEELFTAENGKIRFGLATIKGVGFEAARSIVRERQKKAFADVFDFCKRVDVEKINFKNIEGLVNSGALDDLEPEVSNVRTKRPWLMQNGEVAIRTAKENVQQKAAGVTDLFGDEVEVEKVDASRVESITWEELAQNEQDLLGYAFHRHLDDSCVDECRQLSRFQLSELRPTEGRSTVALGGKIVGLRKASGSNGNDLLFATLQDASSSCEIAFFDNAKVAEEKLNGTNFAIVSCRISEGDEGRLQVQGSKVVPLEEARKTHKAVLVLNFSDGDCGDLQELQDLIRQFKGRHELCFSIASGDNQYRMKANGKWRVELSDQFLGQLTNVMNPEAIQVEYRMQN